MILIRKIYVCNAQGFKGGAQPSSQEGRLLGQPSSSSSWPLATHAPPQPYLNHGLLVFLYTGQLKLARDCEHVGASWASAPTHRTTPSNTSQIDIYKLYKKLCINDYHTCFKIMLIRSYHNWLSHGYRGATVSWTANPLAARGRSRNSAIRSL